MEKELQCSRITVVRWMVDSAFDTSALNKVISKAKFGCESQPESDRAKCDATMAIPNLR